MEDSERQVLKRFVEAVCLEWGLTPDRLIAILTEPGFGVTGQPADWRDHVPPDVIEAWPCLSPDALIVAFTMAQAHFLAQAALSGDIE